MVEADSIESQDPRQDDGAVSTKSGRSRRWRRVWAIVGLAVLCLLALRVAGVVGPKPCASCHDRAAFQAETQSSAHAQVECQACHDVASGPIGEAVFALRGPIHAYFPRSRAAIREAAAVQDSRCLECHQNELGETVASNGIRINHASCAAAVSCTDCHSSTAHGTAIGWVRSYDMEDCLECHMVSGKVACDLCHQGRDAAVRVKTSSFAVTHGPKWQTTHGMGDIATCNVCHTAGDCANCHGPGVPHEPEFVGVHSTYAEKEDAECASCHADAFCDSCHGTEMPHPGTFTSQHVTNSKEQPDLCARCHDDSDCQNCHVKHVHPGGAVGTGATAGGGQ